MPDTTTLAPFASRGGISRRKILGAAGAIATAGSALAGVSVGSRTAVAAPAIGTMSDGDAMALSLFRQWIAAAHEYDRQAAAEPDQDEYPAGDLMIEIEDRIVETAGSAVALAIKTYFKVRADHACWVPATADLRIEEAFQEPPDWGVLVSASMLRAAAAVVPEIGELCAPVLHPDAALIDADMDVQWCRDRLADPFRIPPDPDDEFVRWARDNHARNRDETRVRLAKMLDRIASTEAKTARGAAIKAKHALGAEGLA